MGKKIDHNKFHLLNHTQKDVKSGFYITTLNNQNDSIFGSIIKTKIIVF